MTSIAPGMATATTQGSGKPSLMEAKREQPGAPVATPAMRATAEAFEAVLVGQMTKLMMESSQVSGEFSGGHGEAMFRGVLAEHLGAEITRRGGLGLVPAVLQQIIMLQNGEKP